jgi:hypothetical protein
VVTDYLGKEGEKVAVTQASLAKRSHIETMICNLKNDLQIANRVLEGKK